MSRPLLIGTIALKDGLYCVQTGANVWYPLGGSSGIAEAFRETFNTPGPGDLGRNLYWSAGHVLAMESIGQMRERLNG